MHEVLFLKCTNDMVVHYIHDELRGTEKFDAIVYSDVNTTKGIHNITLHSCLLHLNYVDSNSSKQF